METQFELIKEAMLRSVPRRTRTWLENDENQTMVKRAIVTLVELANENDTENPIFIKSGEREVQERASDYRVPTGYKWIELLNFTTKVSLWDTLLSRGKYCLEVKRPKYSEGFVSVTNSISSYIMTPSEFSLFWTDMIANDSYFACNLSEISKEATVLDKVAGFYNLDSVIGTDDMITVNPSGDKVSIFVSEFFLLTSKIDMSDMSRAQYAPLSAEFKAWLGTPVIKETNLNS